MISSPNRRAVFVLVGLALPATARSQPVEAVELSLVWDKPVIQFGEANTATVWAKVIPDIGTSTAWNTKPGTGQSGTLVAFASTIFNVDSLSNGTNGYVFQGFAFPDWKAFGSGVFETNWQGGFTGVDVGQPGAPFNNSPNTKGFVPLFFFEWKEITGGMPYSVEYAVVPTSAKVHLDVGLASWVGENALKIDGQGGFMVIPAPPSLGAFAFASIAVAWSRRRP